jgi:hypothetical protein
MAGTKCSATNARPPGANFQVVGAQASKHIAKASADLTWNASDQKLHVIIKATGLALNSTHPVHIHVGNCAKNAAGQKLYTLSPLNADGHGNGKSETTVKAPNGIPAKTRFISIHNGPTLN